MLSEKIQKEITMKLLATVGEKESLAFAYKQQIIREVFTEIEKLKEDYSKNRFYSYEEAVELLNNKKRVRASMKCQESVDLFMEDNKYFSDDSEFRCSEVQIVNFKNNWLFERY